MEQTDRIEVPAENILLNVRTALDVPMTRTLFRKIMPAPFALRMSRTGAEPVGMWETMDGLGVLVSRDPFRTQHVLHVSVSRPDRHPSWDEILAVREAFFPLDIDVVQVLPRRRDYVNVHPHTFHLWQCPSAWNGL